MCQTLFRRTVRYDACVSRRSSTVVGPPVPPHAVQTVAHADRVRRYQYTQSGVETPSIEERFGRSDHVRVHPCRSPSVDARVFASRTPRGWNRFRYRTRSVACVAKRSVETYLKRGRVYYFKYGVFQSCKLATRAVEQGYRATKTPRHDSLQSMRLHPLLAFMHTHLGFDRTSRTNHSTFERRRRRTKTCLKNVDPYHYPQPLV